MNEFKNKKESGFTLIEMITTIAIMALILSLTISNIRGTDPARNVLLAQSNLISDLHKVQTYAVNSADYAVGITPASAWGISLSTLSPSNYTIQTTDNTLNANVQTVSTVNLPTNVRVTALQVDRSNGGGSFCPSSVIIQFTVPYGRVGASYVGTPCSGGGTLRETLEPNDVITVTVSAATGSPSQTIVINGISGNIITP